MPRMRERPVPVQLTVSAIAPPHEPSGLGEEGLDPAQRRQSLQKHRIWGELHARQTQLPAAAPDLRWSHPHGLSEQFHESSASPTQWPVAAMHESRRKPVA
jgi:hypothetical protein